MVACASVEANQSLSTTTQGSRLGSLQLVYIRPSNANRAFSHLSGQGLELKKPPVEVS